jgi:hypothetical protein
MGKLDQRTSEAQAREVLMQWNPFGTVEHISQVRGRGADDTPYVGERDVMGVLSFKKLLRAPDQLSRGAVNVGPRDTGPKCGPKECQDHLLRLELVHDPAMSPIQETCAEGLYLWIHGPASLSEQLVPWKLEWINLHHLRKNSDFGGNDELGIPGGHRIAQTVGFAPRDQDDLIGIANHVLTSDVPDEEATIGQTDLERTRESFLLPRMGWALMSHIFDQTDREVQQQIARCSITTGDVNERM